MRPGSVVVTLVVLLAAATGSTGCDDSPPGPAVDELSAHEDQPCPGALPATGAGTDPTLDRNATASVEPGRPDRAWVCTYEPVPAGRGRGRVQWPIAEEATSLTGPDLDRLVEALGTLQPAPGFRVCPGGLGDRVLFVTAVGADLTGYAVDLFGCEFVRMTDDPYAHPPGRATQPGTVPGVLVSEALVQLAR